MAEDLANKTGQDLGTVRQIVKDNPGLSEEEYRELLEYEIKYEQYYQENQGKPNVHEPTNVKSVSQSDGNTYWSDQSTLDHIRASSHGEDFKELSDDSLAKLIRDMLNGEWSRIQSAH